MAMMAVFLVGIVLILIEIYLVLRVIAFFFAARGLQVMAKNRHQKNAWFAYIPLLQNLALGKVVGTIRIFKQEMHRSGLYLTILLALAGICRIPYFNVEALIVLGNIFLALYVILRFIVYYNLFSNYLNHKGKTILFTALSVIFGYFSLASYLIFAIRKKPYCNEDETEQEADEILT